jgi:hypothetical protein
MSKHLSSSLVVGCLVTVGLLLASADARAEDDRDREHRGSLMLALDLNYTSTISNDLIKSGGGGALRIGTQRHLPFVTLIPELVVDYQNFDSTPDRASIVTGKLGGRIRFLEVVEPGIYAHIGVGHVSGDEQYTHTGVAFDAGLTLDLTILPLIDLGLHVAWNRVFGGYDSGTSYSTVGAHAALVL